jgi:DNA-binding LacI/PurR family transcriptional regulator
MQRERLRFAVLMDIAFSAFHAEIKTGIDRYLEEADLDAVYFGIGRLDADNPIDRARMAFLDFVTTDDFDGVIFIPAAKYSPWGKEILKKKFAALGSMPRVTIGPSAFGEDSVCFDNEQGMSAIMRHLIDDHGFKRFAYVSGPLSNAEAIIRLGAYRAALDKAGLPHGKESEYEGDFQTLSGSEAVPYLLDGDTVKPEVIVCANDRMAFGVWNALERRGIRVPFDIAVTGYDDTLLLSALSHQFTTVRQSFDRLGYLAALRLHAFVRGKKPPESETLQTELRIRSSCGCVDIRTRGLTTAKKKRKGSWQKEAQDRIVEHIRNGSPPRGEGDFLQAWTETIRREIGENGRLYELEECLRETRLGMKDTPCASRTAMLLPTLHAMILEQSAQKAFAEYWDEKSYLNEFWRLLESLEVALSNDSPLSANQELIAQMLRLMGARTFHLVRFATTSSLEGKATLAYTTTVGGLDWRPSIGSWIPPGSRSLVANMVAVGDKRYGYYLLDARIPQAATFEGLRIALSGIAHAMVNRAELLELRKIEQALRERIAALEGNEMEILDKIDKNT